jgi:hypothetical protein
VTDEDQERAKARDAVEVRLAVAREWLLRQALELLRSRTDENLLATGQIKGSPVSITTANDNLEHAARDLAEASIAAVALDQA